MSPAVSPSPSCRPALARGALRRRAEGDVLIEALICIAIVGLGALPLAMLGSAWLRLGGQHERLNATLLLVAEQAEAGQDHWALISGDGARVALCDAVAVNQGCVPGQRIALASLPPSPSSVSVAEAMPVAHIALWMQP
jgi:hypothetical protein